ncbi:hypothetical protein N7507_000205 [Penicillium longicatenatum]|nr:hypothetical protein N7507_000205 [Penicillium longicatenatum]
MVLDQHLFVDQRSSIVSALDKLLTHIPRIEGTQSTHTDWLLITKSLTDEKQRINSLLSPATAQDQGQSSCFGYKINVISLLIDWVIEELENFNTSFAADSLLIISTQIGLLSFEGFEDSYSDEMDNRTQRFEGKYNLGDRFPSDVDSKLCHLWEALTSSVPGCSCFQCKKL